MPGHIGRRAATILSLFVVAVSGAAAAETRLRVNVFKNPQNIALFVAREKGFFAGQELAIDIAFTPNSRAQRSGLVQGTFDIAQSAVDNAVALVEVEQADVVIV